MIAIKEGLFGPDFKGCAKKRVSVNVDPYGVDAEEDSTSPMSEPPTENPFLEREGVPSSVSRGNDVMYAHTTRRLITLKGAKMRAAVKMKADEGSGKADGQTRAAASNKEKLCSIS